MRSFSIEFGRFGGSKTKEKCEKIIIDLSKVKQYFCTRSDHLASFCARNRIFRYFAV